MKYHKARFIVSIIEKWKKILDDKGFGGAVLMDLSKTFDTLNHKLLLLNFMRMVLKETRLN